MPEVKNATLAALPLIAADDLSLHADAVSDELLKQIAIPGKQRIAVILHQFENIWLTNHTVLHGFEQAGPVLAFGKRGQHIRIDQHTCRLMKRAQKILAIGEIDSGLATDRGIDLRHQRRRDLYHRNSAHEH